MIYKVILTSFSLTTNTLSISLSFNTVDENICQGCGAHFEDDDDEDDQQAWIGCDKKGCERCGVLVFQTCLLPIRNLYALFVKLKSKTGSYIPIAYTLAHHY